MKKKSYFICLLSLVISFLMVLACSSPAAVELDQLNGYWEITSVQLENGASIQFGMSTTVDFIEVKDSLGFRKKVNPKLDGSFETSDSFERFSVTTQNDSIRLHYKTDFDTWTETVVATSDSTLSVRNKDQKIYHYKRFKPFQYKSN